MELVGRGGAAAAFLPEENEQVPSWARDLGHLLYLTLMAFLPHLGFRFRSFLSPLKLAISKTHFSSLFLGNPALHMRVCVCTYAFIHPAVPSQVRQEARTAPDGVLGAGLCQPCATPWSSCQWLELSSPSEESGSDL